MKPVGNTPSLHARLTDELRSAIVSGELEPGRLYSVKDLAEQLAVSRTPVREALIALAETGMVKPERNKGFRIQQTTTHDLGEVFQIRLLLEVPATRKTTAKMTPMLLDELRSSVRAMQDAAIKDDIDELWKHDRRFHWLILSGTGNRRLAEYVEGLRDRVLTQGTITAGRSRSAQDIVEEHVLVMEQIERRNPRGAAAEMREHILNTARLLIAQEAGTSEAVRDIDLDWLVE